MSANLILLDVDGVCADFIGQAAKLFGKDPNISDWDFYKSQWGMTTKEFWGGIDDAGINFWAHMPEFHYFADFYQALKKIAPVKFCTSLVYNPYALAGRLLWFQNRFGRSFTDYFIAPDKSPLAKPTTLLIDDNDRNVQKFRAAGGIGILFPQPWNEAAATAGPCAWTIALGAAALFCKKDLRSWECMVE